VKNPEISKGRKGGNQFGKPETSSYAKQGETKPGQMLKKVRSGFRETPQGGGSKKTKQYPGGRIAGGALQFFCGKTPRGKGT